MCDTVTVMRDGQVIDTRPISEYTRADMISMMVGRTIENEFLNVRMCGDILMEVRSLNTRKLRNVSFKLRKGKYLDWSAWLEQEELKLSELFWRR